MGSSQRTPSRGIQPWGGGWDWLLGKAKPCFGEEGGPRHSSPRGTNSEEFLGAPRALLWLLGEVTAGMGAQARIIYRGVHH